MNSKVILQERNACKQFISFPFNLPVTPARVCSETINKMFI